LCLAWYYQLFEAIHNKRWLIEKNQFSMMYPCTHFPVLCFIGLVAGRGELPTERLEHTQQQAGGPHHQQSADLEKPASMGGVTRSSALSFGHGGLSATGQQAATSTSAYFFRSNFNSAHAQKSKVHTSFTMYMFTISGFSLPSIMVNPRLFFLLCICCIGSGGWHLVGDLFYWVLCNLSSRGVSATVVSESFLIPVWQLQSWFWGRHKASANCYEGVSLFVNKHQIY
jgi:hypothetical protein